MRLCCIALLLWAGTAADSAGPTCWGGRPLPHGASFVITDVGWYGGARFGSYAAPVAGGLFLLMLAIALAGETT